MRTRVTFEYTPDEDDSTGMSEEEYGRLADELVALGAENIEAERIPGS